MSKICGRCRRVSVLLGWFSEDKASMTEKKNGAGFHVRTGSNSQGRISLLGDYIGSYKGYIRAY